MEVCGYQFSFFWSWDLNKYGVSLNFYNHLVEETLCGQEFDSPELPHKDICNALWPHFERYAIGDRDLDIFFRPVASEDAGRWGSDAMMELRIKYLLGGKPQCN